MDRVYTLRRRDAAELIGRLAHGCEHETMQIELDEFSSGDMNVMINGLLAATLRVPREKE